MPRHGHAHDSAATPAVDVVELNPHWPRPFVFTEIALCLRDQLRAAGFEAEHLVNEVDPDGVSIVFVPTDRWREAVHGLDPARTVLFNMEQLGSDSPWSREGYAASLAAWTVADYHTANVEWLRRANGPGQRVYEIPVLPQPVLVGAPQADAAAQAAADAGAPAAEPAPSVDVLFYGSGNARRERVVAQLRERGLGVEWVSGAYAWELAPALRRARIVLHVHYYETRLFPVARVLQPLASGVPVVCETSSCPRLNDWSGSGIVFADYDRLADACVQFLAEPARQLDAVRRNLRHARRIDTAAPLRALIASLACGPGAGVGAR